MKHLSPNQWLILRASAEPKGCSIFANLNTISALYTRSLIKFVGPTKNHALRFRPTRFGTMHLQMYNIFAETPSFKKSREEMRDIRHSS